MCVAKSDKLYTPIHDHMGSIALLLHGKKAIETVRYAAFGEMETFDANKKSTAPSRPWYFLEGPYEERMKLYLFGKRYYNPKLGRWMTKDPAGFVDGPNLYSYVHNSPLIFIDPYGLLAEENKRSTWDRTRDAVRDGAKQAWNATQEFYKHTKEAVKDTLQVPLGARGFGLMQAGFGASEMGLGVAVSKLSCGLATPLGVAIASHGVDNVHTGFKSFWTGESHRTQTNQGLQSLGMSKSHADLVETGVTLALTAGSSAALKAARFSTNVASVGTKVARVGAASKTVAKKVGRRLKPNMRATGAHTVFKRDPLTREVMKYETFRPQTNPRNPAPWKSVKRFDRTGQAEGHYNKILKMRIREPHVHDPKFPGGIRKPNAWEIP